MKKISYQSSLEIQDPVGPSNDLVDKESSTEDGSRGFNLIEMTSDFDKTDPEIYSTETGIEGSQTKVPDKALNLLISLGDEMDATGEETLANFADFLIKKFAEAKDLDTSMMFNKLMIKVNNAELVNTNEIIKKLTKIYSRTVLLEYLKNKDIIKSKQSAYKKTLHRTEQYLAEE